MERKSYDAVDLAKWLCAWLVMYIHFCPVLSFIPVVDRFISAGLSKVAVPFFFSVSGFFLFQKMDNAKIHRNKNLKILWRFCRRILLLYTVWFAVNFLYKTFDSYYNDKPYISVGIYFWGYFFSGIQAHLWYLMSTVYAAPLVYLLWKTGKPGLVAGCVIGNLMQCLDQPYHLKFVFDSPLINTVRSEYGLLYSAILHGVPMMCVGALCVLGYQKRTNRQWGIRLSLVTIIHLVEIVAWLWIKGENLRAERFLTSGLLIYYLVNWLVTLNFRLPIKWLGKAIRLNSTWIYCAHMLVMMLFHWVFAYQGLVRYLLVGGLTVVSGIPYVVVKLLKDRNNCGRMQAE